MDFSAWSDEDLLVRSQVEPAAFGVFYGRRVDAVLAFFMRRTRDPELAADLTAEAFAGALMSIKRYSPDRPALACLFTIANRKLADSLRRGRVEIRARRRLGTEPLILEDVDLERVEARADAARGDSALALLESLSEEHRQAIEGRVVDEDTYEDLARTMRCSQAVVRQRVSRGLAQLRTRIEES